MYQDFIPQKVKSPTKALTADGNFWFYVVKEVYGFRKLALQKNLLFWYDGVYTEVTTLV